LRRHLRPVSACSSKRGLWAKCQDRVEVPRSAPEMGPCTHPELNTRRRVDRNETPTWEDPMGRGILLWLLGVPIPIIILIALLYR
jgi:hypothetical protein